MKPLNIYGERRRSKNITAFAVSSEEFSAVLCTPTGSAYEQDIFFCTGPLQLLKASAKALPENSPADWNLFYQTTFVRQRNRMVTELRKLLKEIDLEFRNGSDRF